jgi:TrmH family RNA methyltransferase
MPPPRKPSQAEFVRWQKLAAGKYRRREGIFLAEGRKVVEELWKSAWQIEALLGMAGRDDCNGFFLGGAGSSEERGGAIGAAGGEGRKGAIPRYFLSEREWGKLTQDRAPEGVMAVVKIPGAGNWEARLRAATGHVLLIDGINNPNNLGAIMRTARWFGIAMVFLSAGAVDWTHPKVVRTSMGSLFHLEIYDNLNFRDVLPAVQSTHALIGSDVRSGVPPHRGEKRTALLLGSESHGIPEEFLEMIDEKWHIPGAGRADSLSLPQAAAIMMYELTKGRVDGSVYPDRNDH